MVERRRDIEAKIEMELDTEESRIKIEQAKISEKLNRLIDALAEGEPSSASAVMKKIAELEEKKKLLGVELGLNCRLSKSCCNSVIQPACGRT